MRASFKDHCFETVYTVVGSAADYYYDTGKKYPEMVWSETTSDKFQEVKSCFVNQYSMMAHPTKSNMRVSL